MPVRFCEASDPVRIPAETLADLDIPRLFGSWFPGGGEREKTVESFLQTYLTDVSATFS